MKFLTSLFAVFLLAGSAFGQGYGSNTYHRVTVTTSTNATTTPPTAANSDVLSGSGLFSSRFYGRDGVQVGAFSGAGEFDFLHTVTFPGGFIDSGNISLATGTYSGNGAGLSGTGSMFTSGTAATLSGTGTPASAAYVPNFVTFSPSALVTIGTASAAHKLTPIFLGDSITAFGKGSYSYPYYLFTGSGGALFNGVPQVDPSNSGATLFPNAPVAGSATNCAVYQYNTYGHAVATSGTTTGLVLICIGANDYSSSTFSLPQWSGSYGALIQAIHADGAKVEIMTITPRSLDTVAQPAARWEANRQAANYIIRTGTGFGQDLTIDRDALYQPYYEWVNTTISSDGIHPTPYANQLLANQVGLMFGGSTSTVIPQWVPAGTMSRQNSDYVGITGGQILGATINSPALSGTLNGPLSGGDQSIFNFHQMNFSGSQYASSYNAPLTNTLDFATINNSSGGQYGIGIMNGAVAFADGNMNNAFAWFGGVAGVSSTGNAIGFLNQSGFTLPYAGQTFNGNLNGNPVPGAQTFATTTTGLVAPFSGVTYTDNATSSWTQPGFVIYNSSTTGNYIPLSFAQLDNNANVASTMISLVAHVTNHSVYNAGDLGIWMNASNTANQTEAFRFTNTGNLMLLTGTLSLSGTVAAPSNSVTPVAWGSFLSGGVLYKTPLYQ